MNEYTCDRPRVAAMKTGVVIQPLPSGRMSSLSPLVPRGARERISRGWIKKFFAEMARRMVLRSCLGIALCLMSPAALAGPAGTIHYPDLQTLPPTDIGIEYNPVTGQKLLRFSNTIANVGEGPLELIPTNNAA